MSVKYIKNDLESYLTHLFHFNVEIDMVGFKNEYIFLYGKDIDI